MNDYKIENLSLNIFIFKIKKMIFSVNNTINYKFNNTYDIVLKQNSKEFDFLIFYFFIFMIIFCFYCCNKKSN